MTDPATTGPASSTTFGYAEFGDWYDAYRAAFLEPALTAASSSLDELLGEALSDRDLTRIRRTSARIKSKRRAWRKLRRARRDGTITSVSDVPDHVDDLVGLRITCTNLRDIEMVQAVLDGLPGPSSSAMGLGLDPASERDYVIEPKESGYRGWHVNLSVAVESEGRTIPVACELQVRTLLQDTWGELTHEDTYSKDGALPPLVEVLSKRMADLFATLDDIAEDLRTELDRIDEEVLGGAAAVPSDTVEADARSEQAADAASILLARWLSLDRPVELASLAWTLQREFGAEVSDDWFGFGTFKRFLRHAVPEGEISTGRDAYLLPVHPAVEEPDEAETESAVSTVPNAARRLRRIDQGFPLLEAEQWPILFGELAEAWRRVGTIEPTGRAVNRLTRSARDRSRNTGEPLSRRHLDYVAKTVLSVDGTGTPLDGEALRDAFTSATLQRMGDLRVLGERNRKGRAAVRSWLAGDVAT